MGNGTMGQMVGSDTLARGCATQITLLLLKGASNTYTVINKPFPALAGKTTALTQAKVNALLDAYGNTLSAASTAEVDVTALFDAVSLGTDSIGFVVNAGGVDQKEGFLALLASKITISSLASVVLASTTLSGIAAGLNSKLALTPAGNIVGRVVATGLDALATGTVVQIDFHVQLK